MSIYGVQRIEKYKKTDLIGIQKESNRTAKKYNNDVDISRKNENIYIHRCENWRTKVESVIKDKGVRIRKDSNVCIGCVYTASPDFFEQKPGESEDDKQDRILGYFMDCYLWHLKKYCNNDSSLMLTCVIHMDETTPHMQAYSIPIIEKPGRYGQYSLSAKVICGNVKQYTKRVDEFYREVSSHYGLERGEPGIGMPSQERKRHIETQKHKERVLKNQIDNMTEQAENLRQRMDSLYNEYSEQYDEIDKVDYIFKRLESEYPDYCKELITDFQNQSYILEYEGIEER